jgi:ADP-ribosylglycohydrolase
MSAAVFGLYPELEDAMKSAIQQAVITHNTTDGRNAAAAVAGAAWYVRNRAGKSADLGRWLNERVKGGWDAYWDQGKVSVKAMDCARAAIHILRTSRSMKEIMQRSVVLRGDVDTVACIAGAIGSLSDGIEQDIPQVLCETLENGPFGRDYLADLDRRLMDHFHVGT